MVFYWQITLPSNFKIDNLQGGEIHNIGHGGNGYYASEDVNSLEAFKAAIDSDINGSEMDIQMTKDSVFVVFHNAFISQSEDCQKLIFELTLEQLKACADKPIAVLEDVLNLNWKNGAVLSFDLKYPPKDPDLQNTLCQKLRAVQNAHPNLEILVESNVMEVLTNLKTWDVSNVFYYCTQPNTDIETSAKHKFDGISIRNELITSEQAKAAHVLGLRVMIWGTRYPSHHREAVLKSPDIVQTDNPQLLQRLLLW
ncbi:glycerophosphodiester phosphodiesterase [Bacteroidota bacterium]